MKEKIMWLVHGICYNLAVGFDWLYDKLTWDWLFDAYLYFLGKSVDIDAQYEFGYWEEVDYHLGESEMEFDFESNEEENK